MRGKVRSVVGCLLAPLTFVAITVGIFGGGTLAWRLTNENEIAAVIGAFAGAGMAIGFLEWVDNRRHTLKRLGKDLGVGFLAGLYLVLAALIITIFAIGLAEALQ